MSGHDINMLRANLRKALTKIGTSNGLACPDSQSNTDPVLHELYVASEINSYGKKRYEDARDRALNVGFDDGELTRAVARVIATGQGENLMSSAGSLYAMTVNIARPAERVDTTALRNWLTRVGGMSQEQVDKAFAAATSPATPAKRVQIVAR